jgi:hypothetical protein
VTEERRQRRARAVAAGGRREERLVPRAVPERRVQVPNIMYFDVYNINKKYNGQIINIIFNCFGSVLVILYNKIEIYVPYIKYKYILNINFLNKFIVVNW